MFTLTNGKVYLQPFKVTYEQKMRVIVKEGYFDDEFQKFIPPEIKTDVTQGHCYFESLEAAVEYAYEVNGEVTDLTPDSKIVSALRHMTFSNTKEVMEFIENGIEPSQKVTLESLAEVIADIIGGLL